MKSSPQRTQRAQRFDLGFGCGYREWSLSRVERFDRTCKGSGKWAPPVAESLVPQHSALSASSAVNPGGVR